jgi:simple sugar transport system permease protein
MAVATQRRQRQRRKPLPLGLLARLLRSPESGAAIAAIGLYVFFAVMSAGNGFTSLDGTASWLNAAALLGIIAIPVGLLMIAGDFDLSIGSMVAAGSIVVGILTGHFDQPLLVSVAAALAIGVVVGLANGLLVTTTGLPSFIVTLATNLIVAGLALALSTAITGSTQISVTTDGFVTDLFAAERGTFSISILWWAVVVVVAGWVLGQTRFGNWILATGGDRERARRAGVATSRVKVSLFVCTAVASAFVGVLQAVQFHTGDATTGQGYVFQAPIVVVIGGVLLMGGYGTMLGVVLGTITYGIINAGLFYAGWNADYAQVVIGSLMVVAVLTNDFIRRLAITSFRRTDQRREDG